MEEVTGRDVQVAYHAMMDLIDKAQWTTYTDPLTEATVTITGKTRDGIKANASTAVEAFKTILDKYVAETGVK